MEQTIKTGRFFGVGVGPGDPELLTLKAARLIQAADVLVYLVNQQGLSQALDIAQAVLGSIQSRAECLPVFMPMSRDPNIGSAVYDETATRIDALLAKGKNVVFLCEGDPLFFGSYSYLLERLQHQYCCQVVPGITSPQAAAATLNQPLTMLKESYAVISGRHSDEQILATLLNHDAVVIMKAGSARPRILKQLSKAKRLHEAHYLEFIGRENQTVISDLEAAATDVAFSQASGPYFSLFVITPSGLSRRSGQGTRAQAFNL